MSLKHLRIAGYIAGSLVAIVKAVGDYRRHQGHDGHSQKCDCFAGCTGCYTDAALHG